MPRYRLPLLLTPLLFCGCELIGGIDDRALVSVTGGAPGSGGEGAGSEAGSAEGGQGGGGCGVVGHDCLGGDCIDGVCQPVLVTDVLSATALAVGGPNIYWSIAVGGVGEVRYCPKTGCDGDTKFLLGGIPEITNLTVGLNTVFSVSTPSPGRIIGCAVEQDGCPEYAFSVNAIHGPNAVAVDGSSALVYFSTLGDELDPAANWLYQCSFGSCTAPTELLSTRASAIATDAEYLYWIDETTSRVRRCDPMSCVDTDQDVTPNPDAGGLDLDLRSGWVTYAGLEKNVYRCELSGAGVCGTTIMLAETSTTVATFAIDDAYVYFVEKSHDPRPIRRASLTGDGDEEIATGQVDVIELVQDEAAVYWIAAGEGTVGSLRKVAKPAQ